jgi:hypothetical protein
MAIAMRILRMAQSYATQAEALFSDVLCNDSFEDRREFRNLELDEIPYEIIIDVAVVMNQHVALADDFSPRDFGVRVASSRKCGLPLRRSIPWRVQRRAVKPRRFRSQSVNVLP